MLNKPIDKILYDGSGRVKGVESEGKPAYCKQLIGDPSYFIGSDKIKKIGQIARCICIMSHPIADTNDADSCQIIIPALSTKGRKNDLYVSLVSYHHKVAAKGKYVAVVSGVVEQKGDEAELKPALDLLGKIDQKFFWVSDSYEAANDSSKDGVFVTRTYDATTHFESATNEVLDLYFRISGTKVDLSISAEPDDLGAQEDAAAGVASAEAVPTDVAEVEKALAAAGDDEETTKDK
jgi:Rab GDP dissociation inhibitor